MGSKKGSGLVAEVVALLDRIDELLVDDPLAAAKAVQLLPPLVVDLDHDTKARAYTSIGLAFLKTGNEPAAREAFAVAQAEAPLTRPETRALVKLRAAALLSRKQHFEAAELELQEALDLALLEPTGSLIPRIQIQRGAVAFLQGDHRLAADRTVSALESLPKNHRLRPLAGWNLILYIYHFEGRDAQKLLHLMSQLELRCRRCFARSKKKRIADCMICWAEGYLCGLLGYQPHSTRCLTWAAGSLFELGAVCEATLCAFDLVAFEPNCLIKITKIVHAFVSDTQIPSTIREAAGLWLKSPSSACHELLRSHLLHTQQANAAFGNPFRKASTQTSANKG